MLTARSTEQKQRPAFPWRWSLPSVTLLLTMAVWGASVYPRLADRVATHFGPNGVDRWADKSIGAVFSPVFVYAGVTVVMALTTLLVLSVTPRDELPQNASPSPLINRPRDRIAQIRTAKATLALNACIGVSVAIGCWFMWHTTKGSRLPAWVMAGMLAPTALGVVALLVAGARRKRTQAQ